MAVFARARDELALHPLELEPQHHHHVGPGQCGIEIVVRGDLELLDLGRHQRGWGTDPHLRAERGQRVNVRPGDTAVQDVAADHDLQSVERFTGLAPGAQRAADRQRVEQALGRMLVLAVAGVEHRAADLVGNQPDRARTGMADHDGIGPHGIERQRGVDQGLALFHAGGGGMHVDHVGPQSLAGNFEAQQRAGRILEEGVDDRQPGQQVGALVPLAVEVDPLFGLVQQEEQFVRSKPGETQQVTVREGGTASRVAAGRGRERRCHRIQRSNHPVRGQQAALPTVHFLISPARLSRSGDCALARAEQRQKR